MDLEPFTRINPCGFNQLQMTQIANFKYVQMENVIRQLTDAIIHVFNYEIKVMIHRPEITRLPNVELAYA
jgi:lipoate-protein ligase B